MNTQHGQERPHPVGVVPLGVLVIGALISSAILIFGASINWGEDKPERAVGHIVVHVAQPDPIPPCPKPRPIGTPVTQ